MRRWLIPLSIAFVSTASAVAVNFATDQRFQLWTWPAVAILTIVGAVLDQRARRQDAQPTKPQIKQSAIASGNATINQSAGDINQSGR